MTERPGRGAVFLARGSYRQRRYHDLLRALPAAAIVLFLIPLLWPRGASATSDALTYLFSVWALLIVAAGILSRLVRYSDDDDPEAEAGPGDRGPGG